MSLRNAHGITRKFTTALQSITEALDIQLSDAYEAIGAKEHYDRGLLRIQTMERLPGVVSSFVASDKSDDTILAFRDAFIEECIFHPQFPYGAVGTIRSVFTGFVNARKEAIHMRERYDKKYEECEELKELLNISEQKTKEERELRTKYANELDEHRESLAKANAEIDSLIEEKEELSETIELLRKELEELEISGNKTCDPPKGPAKIHAKKKKELEPKHK